LVIRFTSEPAYSTFTAPEPVAEEDGEAAADVAAALEAGVLAAGALDELDELEDELQAAAVRPRHAIPSAAVSRRDDDRNIGMTLTLASTTCVTQ
jgi:hypothetical protein